MIILRADGDRRDGRDDIDRGGAGRLPVGAVQDAAPDAALLTLGLLAVVGAPAAVVQRDGDVKIFRKNFFDLYDYASSNVLLPVGGLFLCIFVGWVWGFDSVQTALTNRGTLNNTPTVRAFFTLSKYITPLLVLLVLLDGLNII